MENIIKILNSKSVSKIRKHFHNHPPQEIAFIINELETRHAIKLIKVFKEDVQFEIFRYLEADVQKEIVKSLPNQKIKALIEDLYTEEAADLIEELPDELSEKVLSLATQETREDIEEILTYEDDQVGSIMSTDMTTLNINWSVGRALSDIKKNIDDVHFSRNYYVVDDNDKLIGYIKTKEFIFEKRTILIKDILKPATPITDVSNKEEAAQIFAKYEMATLPVIDARKKMVGILLSDDIIDVIQEEAQEDFQVMAGIQASEKTYSDSNVFKLFKSRVMWLLLLMISSTLSQIVLDSFINISGDKLKETAAPVIAGLTTAIVAILPVISGAAGNAGSQSSTTIIRALATGDITPKDYMKVFFKELRASSLIGFVLGVANFVRLLLYYTASDKIDDVHYIALAGAASLSLTIVIMLAQIVGGILPLIAKVLKLDPAVMAAPLLTTLIDALSTVIFFGISIGIMILVI